MMATPASFSPMLTCTQGEQLYLRIVRPLSTNLHSRAQTGSTEPFSTARDSHNFHEPSNTQEDHNRGDNEDDDDDDDDDDGDVSSEIFAVIPQTKLTDLM